MMSIHCRMFANPKWMTRTWITLAIGPRLTDCCRFVGLSGGEIFHEMMLRQGVKHVCQFTATSTGHVA